MKWLITLFLVFLLASGSTAQSPPLRFEHLTVNQGLSNPIVHAMLQDSHGYLWFATDNGLNKYNGYTMTTYQKIPGDTTSLVSNVIYQLIEDREGYIWLGMAGQGICKFDPRTETFTCYGPTPRTLSEGTIYTMGEDGEGYIWVSNGRDELRRFDKKNGTFSTFNYATLLAEKRNHKVITPVVTAIYSDRKKAIWVASEWGLHRLYSTSTKPEKPQHVRFTTYHHDPANAQSLTQGKVWRVHEDQAGLLWVSTETGLDQFNPKTETFAHYRYNRDPAPAMNAAINQSLLYMVDDHEGNLWIGTPDHGLVKFDSVKGQFTQLLPDPGDPASLSSIHIRSLLVDRSGLLWVGTWGEGIDKANPGGQSFAYYRPLPYHPHSLSYKFVSFIVEDRLGTIWVGTGDGLNRMNKQTGEFTHYRHQSDNPKSLPKRNAEAMLEDRKGNMWVASNGELSLFNRQTGEFNCLTCTARMYPGLGDNIQILTIYQDRLGLLWLGTTNGIKCFNPRTGKVIQYAYNPKDTTGISEAYAMALLEDNRGNLWVGTESIALNRLDRKTGRFTHYRPNRFKPGSISSDGVSCIFQDTKGNLWFGTTGGGLCRFDYEKETFQTFTKADGLADNSVFSIDEDNQGNLWLGTHKGLSRFSFETRTFRNYEVNNGLQNAAFRRPHCKGKDGILYFGGDDGFTAFDPRKLTKNLHSPPLVITQVKLFDKPMPGVEATSKIDLAYNENYLSFEFAALNYANPSKNQYAYRLVGVDKNWVYSGSRRYVSYTNLYPGTYTFRVKGSNNDGVWNPKGTFITVTIHPPWWQTIWFRLTGGLLLALVVFASVRLYTLTKLRQQRNEMKRVLQTQESERQRIAADLHDDLGGVIATINHQLTQSLTTTSLTELQQELQQIRQVTSQAGDKVRSIAHNLMPPDFQRLGLVASVQQLISSLNDPRFQCVVFGEPKRLPADIELNAYRILSELIHNVQKHAQAQQVLVQLLFHPDRLSLVVEDNGVGSELIKNGGNQAGIGLKNISSRVNYLTASWHTDTSEQGTTTIVEIPYGFEPR
jgi:ligand-binding sensor domain-containing protein/signal transduction histidine kinase